uniref:Uncharacterized protein n=1 Tax=Parastrongyloides trichosuri TaxID=131310 RepID=A0A0N4ZRD1_PARTI
MLICVPISDVETYMTAAAYPESNTSSTRIVEINPFCYNDEKYKCLCKKIHIKVGTYFFAYLTIIAYIISTILAWVFESHYIVSIGISILASIAILTSILLIFGVKKEKRQLCLPYLVFCIISIVVLATFIILCTLVIINRNHESVKNILFPNSGEGNLNKEQRENLVTNISILIAISLSFLLITIWAFFIVFRTYRFIGDILAARKPIKVLKNAESM